MSSDDEGAKPKRESQSSDVSTRGDELVPTGKNFFNGLKILSRHSCLVSTLETRSG